MSDGNEFQAALPDGATVRVVGLGGIGQPVAAYLARYLASRGRPARLVLIDGDAYEPHNASRMDVPELYRNKARATHAERRRAKTLRLQVARDSGIQLA